MRRPVVTRRVLTTALVLLSFSLAWLLGPSLACAEPSVSRPVPVERAPSQAPSCPPIPANPFEEGEPRDKVIDINQADERALLDLPGIGPARARAILDYRSAHGGFRSLSQLLNIKGIGRSLLKQLRPLITFSSVGGSTARAAP